MPDDAPPAIRLSEQLARLVRDDPTEFTLNEILERTEGRGLFLVIILICLPFISPIPLPGVGTVLGAVIAVLALRLAFKRPSRLPAFLGTRPFPSASSKKLLAASVRILIWIEHLARPRRSAWLGWPTMQFSHALLLSFMAVLLMLPFPPFPPFTNALPAYAIMVLSVSLMEADGVLVWLAYLLCAATVTYLLLIVHVHEMVLAQLYNWLSSAVTL